MSPVGGGKLPGSLLHDYPVAPPPGIPMSFSNFLDVSSQPYLSAGWH